MLKSMLLAWAELIVFQLTIAQILQTSARASDRPSTANVPQFGIFEQAFTPQQNYTNPYVELTANASFLPPDGRPRSIPLFWNGGTEWKVRFSPDTTGDWS